MATKIMSKGQALSTWPQIVGDSVTNALLFSAPTPGALEGLVSEVDHHTVRIQGFKWTGGSALTVKDSQGTVLYNHASTANIYPVTASGSFGLTCTIPLYVTTAGTGGTLIVYGEVL